MPVRFWAGGIKLELFRNMVRDFVRDEEGQDLIEYSLLIGLIVMASAALFAHAGSSVNAVWGDAKTVLSTAAVASGS
jgi:Flp pilus assembly pilin Flp